ncbi:unnamed protein product [Heterosigma akashiwo]
MVELQGDLDYNTDSLADMHLGDLTYENGTPVLVIGNHKLEGSDIALSDPLVVMRKVSLVGSQFSLEKNDSGGVHEHRSMLDMSENGRNMEYLVQGFITKKVIFKNRPKPIVKKRGLVSS